MKPNAEDETSIVIHPINERIGRMCDENAMYAMEKERGKR
jgi:hypothetical protein